ncbi:conserved hypothetical protein [Vibrio chagasii]|nr:conserved hypothetical protein [Vibrio chagasii]
MISKDGKHGGLAHLLSLIGGSKKTLIDVFESGTVRENHENAGDLAKLKEARAVIATARGYRVHPKLAGFINYFLETETSQFLGTQHAERIGEIRELSERYLDLKLKVGSKQQEVETFDVLESVVYEITMDLQESCRRLLNRVNYDFGYGKTLAQKKAENQIAIDQSERLAAGLKAFSFRLLADIASDNQDLNTLLCQEMHPAIRSCQQDLESVLAQLRKLMVQYRAREKDKDLVSSFDRYFEQNTTWSFDNDEVLPSPEVKGHSGENSLWLSTTLNLESLPDLDDDMQDDELSELASKVTSAKDVKEELPELEIAEDRIYSLNEEVQELASVDIDTYCDDFFTSVFRADGELDAMSYYENVGDTPLEGVEPLTCHTDVWLFAVMNYHTSMLPAERRFFTCKPVGELAYKPEDFKTGFGNLHVENIYVSKV